MSVALCGLAWRGRGKLCPERHTLAGRMLQISTFWITIITRVRIVASRWLPPHQVGFAHMRSMTSDTKARFLGLIGLGTIAVWLTLSLGSGFYLSIMSLRWPKVPVRVISAGVSTASSTLGNLWAPDVEYAYSVKGQAYHSDTIRYLMPPFFEKDQAQAVLAAFPPQAQTRAAYDPQDPARSVLEPGVPAGMWGRILIPLFFWLLTAYIFYEIVHPDRRMLLTSEREPTAQE